MTPLIFSKKISAIQNVTHGFGLRGITATKYLDELGVKDRFIFETDQVHGNAVHYLMYPKKGPVLDGDAYITDRPGIVCFVRSADCVPILIADKNRPAIAAIHAGWKGSALDIVGTTIKAMNEIFGSEPNDLVAAIGPRICGKCYEVGPEVIDAMNALRLDADWRVSERHIDLGNINRALLERAGVKKNNIEMIDLCTKCDGRFASYRRDRSESERQFNFIILNPS